MEQLSVVLYKLKVGFHHTRVSSELVDGLVQDCSNSIAKALELLLSCTKPSIWMNTNHSSQNDGCSLLYLLLTLVIYRILRHFCQKLICKEAPMIKAANIVKPDQNLYHFADNIPKCVFLSENPFPALKEFSCFNSSLFVFVIKGTICHQKSLVHGTVWYRTIFYLNPWKPIHWCINTTSHWSWNTFKKLHFIMLFRRLYVQRFH